MKRKVFNNINHIAMLFLKQKQYEAMTPLVYIQGKGKGRRFYFKGDTCYSYRDSFPLARIEGKNLYVKDFCPSNTTKKHRRVICYYALDYDYSIIYSDDLKTPICLDLEIKRNLEKLMKAKSWARYYKTKIKEVIEETIYSITKSKFPILFDEKHKKLRQMLFSNDFETFNLARKIIKQQKLI